MKDSMKKGIVIALLILLIIIVTIIIFVLVPQKKENDSYNSYNAYTDNNASVSENVSENNSNTDENINLNSNSNSNVSVTDALNYSKDVIPVNPEFSDYSNEKHHIVIPKLTADTETAAMKAFNSKIYNQLYDVYNTLINNTEDSYIYDVSYKYKRCNDVIGIMVVKMCGIQDSEIWYDIYTYYYDVKSDRELTKTEYLAALGTNENEIFEKFKRTSDYKDMDSEEVSAEATVLIGYILDEKSAVICISNDTFPLGSVFYYEYNYSFIS